ncbi:MAG TPA: enoyl-CoA hydratase-related protein [Planctomycetota bacterium]|jgi:enoyl-CoA hydratase/carnithine racemase|nr:enoyl-CoA hydratase-related protein [Planctomycetota bacterium]
MSDLVLRERDGPIALLRLHRPEVLNALSFDLLGELRAAVDALAADRTVRAVVLSGAGERAFSAGADLKERGSFPPEKVRAYVDRIRSTFTAVAELPAPTVAAIQGICLGGGLELALACDLRIADPRALLGLPETSLAILPGAGGTQRLPRLIGKAFAKELVLTARRIPASEAHRMGLVNEVAAEGRAFERAKEVASAIAANGPVAIRAAKRAIDQGFEVPLAEGLALEGRCYEETIPTKDRLEALAAFREKRKPAFQGE